MIDPIARPTPPRTSRHRAVPRPRGPADPAVHPRQAEADRAAERAEAGHHPPRRHPRPRPQRPPQALRRGVAGGRAGALGGTIRCRCSDRRVERSGVQDPDADTARDGEFRVRTANIRPGVSITSGIRSPAAMSTQSDESLSCRAWRLFLLDEAHRRLAGCCCARRSRMGQRMTYFGLIPRNHDSKVSAASMLCPGMSGRTGCHALKRMHGHWRLKARDSIRAVRSMVSTLDEQNAILESI